MLSAMYDWAEFGKCVAVFLNGDAIPEPDARGQRVFDDSFLLCFNAHYDAVDFVTPHGDYAQQWTVELETADPTDRADVVVNAGDKVTLPGRSLLVLRKTL
jgi:isoamylase